MSTAAVATPAVPSPDQIEREALGFGDATDDVFAFNNEPIRGPRVSWCCECGSTYRGDGCPCLIEVPA